MRKASTTPPLHKSQLVIQQRSLSKLDIQLDMRKIRTNEKVGEYAEAFGFYSGQMPKNYKYINITKTLLHNRTKLHLLG